MSLVTLSASYGAGGSQVGPALAKRLDVPFVDRVISTDVAERLAASSGAELGRDDATSLRPLARLMASLAPIGLAFGLGEVTAETASPRTVREVTEEVIFERAAAGRGVILGRAAAVVLRDDPRALHVRLDGPRERRLLQAMRIQGIDRETADRRMNETDRARYAYVRHFRRADARDPDLYHLIIDSTIIDLNRCVEIIAVAAAGATPATIASPGFGGGSMTRGDEPGPGL